MIDRIVKLVRLVRPLTLCRDKKKKSLAEFRDAEFNEFNESNELKPKGIKTQSHLARNLKLVLNSFYFHVVHRPFSAGHTLLSDTEFKGEVPPPPELIRHCLLRAFDDENANPDENPSPGERASSN